jgi:hypothetical protein
MIRKGRIPDDHSPLISDRRNAIAEDLRRIRRRRCPNRGANFFQSAASRFGNEGEVFFNRRSASTGFYRRTGAGCSFFHGGHDNREAQAAHVVQRAKSGRAAFPISVKLRLKSSLLLVVDAGAFGFLPLRIGAGGGDGAGLAIRRHCNIAVDGDLVTLLNGEGQSAVVDLLVRPRV